MSFSLTAEQLDELFDQIPALMGKPRQVEDLSGGLTNRNIKVTTPDGRFVARCTDTSADVLDIDRDQEHHNSKAAEAAGVGAPVIDYRSDLGIMVIGYIDGHTLTNDDFLRPEIVARVADGCRRLHAGPRFRGEFNMFERQAAYLDTVQEKGYRIPADYVDHADKVEDIRKALVAQNAGTVPCNNDLLAGNFVDDGAKMWLIDYEYSGNNDPCFELGNIWSECQLTLDQLHELVNVYYGRPLRNKLARARLQGIVSKYGWTLWGCIQNAISPLDFDFWEWAMERYETAVAELTGPDLAVLLHDVQLSD
jgi:thiamine kinase-like enzyme